MPLDDQLIRNQTDTTNEPDSSADKAGALNRAKRGELEGGEATDFRSSRMSAIRAKAGKLKAKLSIGQKSFSAATSKILQSAWRNIVISFGFSFLYVYAHLFLQQIFGKNLFAPLGSEWRDRPGLTIEERERMGVPFKLMESFGVGCLTIVLLIAIIFAFSIPALIIEVVTNPLRTFVSFFKEFFSWLTGS
ncbi:MAG: hypothetical protein PHE20_00355 [Patescibacteria group bacterium]|nr:hypothetical protein [Patescibacteria group bacterium]